MPVLSIQSSVVYGHVGNSAAAFALERLGIEVWPVHTVTLAHHPGHGGWRGQVARSDEISALIAGLDAIGALKCCDAVLSGYLGDAALGAPLLDAVARVKRANPKARYLCDPVMGEVDRGFYVRADIPEFFRDQALPLADILTPNAFELGWLARCEVGDLGSAHAAARALLSRGPRLIVVTGLERMRRGSQRIGALAVTEDGSWFAECPFVAAPAHGAGDLFAALFLGRYLKDRRIPRALTHAVSALHAVMRATRRRRGIELDLIGAQAALAAPKRLFKADKIG